MGRLAYNCPLVVESCLRSVTRASQKQSFAKSLWNITHMLIYQNNCNVLSLFREAVECLFYL